MIVEAKLYIVMLDKLTHTCQLLVFSISQILGTSVSLCCHGYKPHVLGNYCNSQNFFDCFFTSFTFCVM